MIRVETSSVSPPGTTTFVVVVAWRTGMFVASAGPVVVGGVGGGWARSVVGWSVCLPMIGGAGDGRGSRCAVWVGFGDLAVRWGRLMAAVAGGAWMSTARRIGGFTDLPGVGVIDVFAWRASGVIGLHGLVGRRMVGPDASSSRLAARSRTLARIRSGVNGMGGGAWGGGDRQHFSNSSWNRSSSSMSSAICAWSDMLALRNVALY